MITRFKRRFGVSAVLTMLGAVVSAVGGLWAFAYENQSVGTPAVVVLVGAFITAVGALWSSGERTQFEHDLRESSDEIARLNREIMNSVTGGDSWCKVFMGLAETAPGKGGVFISNDGKYPIYDLTVTMSNATATRQAREAGEADWFGRNRTIISVGNLRPGKYVLPIAVWSFPTYDEQDYIFDFEARNGWFRQPYKLRRVNGHWSVATRVFESVDSGEIEVLYKSVSDDFPRDEQGEVDWNIRA